MNTTRFDLRLLGLIALIGAPAMFIETLRHVRNGPEDTLTYFLYGAFSFGWLCALLGLRQLEATGTGKWGRGLLTFAVVTATLAIGQTFMDLLHVPTGNPLYVVTDLAWPITMLLTFVISVTTLFARRLPVWGRLVLLYASFSLPLTIVFSVLHLQLPFDTFGPHTATGWGLWGILLMVLGQRGRAASPSALTA